MFYFVSKGTQQKGKGNYSYDANKENTSFSMDFMVHWYGKEEKKCL